MGLTCRAAITRIPVGPRTHTSVTSSITDSLSGIALNLWDIFPSCSPWYPHRDWGRISLLSHRTLAKFSQHGLIDLGVCCLSARDCLQLLPHGAFHCVHTHTHTRHGNWLQASKGESTHRKHLLIFHVICYMEVHMLSW